MQQAILKALIELAELVIGILISRWVRRTLREGSFQIKHKLLLPV